MTIGMLVESLASKAGALGGRFVDATPFQRSDGKVCAAVGCRACFSLHTYFGLAQLRPGFTRLHDQPHVGGIVKLSLSATTAYRCQLQQSASFVVICNLSGGDSCLALDDECATCL